MSEQRPKFYTIEPSQPPMSMSFATAAMRECGLCGVFVDGSGGGGYRSLCVSCVDDLDSGMLRRFIDKSALRAWRLEKGDFNEVR